MPTPATLRGQQQAAPWIRGPLLSPFFGLLPPGLLKRLKDFFVYNVDFINLAAAGTVTNVIGIQADSDFLVVSVNLTARQHAAPQTVVRPAPMLITIQDQGSGRNFQNLATDADNLVGNGLTPGYLEYAKLVRANSVISVTLQNLDGGVAFDVRVALRGFKVFTAIPEQQV